VCGAIDQYNTKPEEREKGPYPWWLLIGRQIRMEGFVVPRWIKEWDAFVKEVRSWVEEGKIKYKEHVTEGFSNMPAAFFGLLRGENTGKAVVRA